MTAPERRLDGRVVLVTGAARGIGRAVAERLAKAGAQVTVVDRDPCDLDVALSLTADLSDPAAAASVVPAVVQALGRLDVLVNNAGRAVVTPVLDEDDNWERTMAVNVGAPLRLAQQAIRAFREQAPVAGVRGRVLNISSGAALNGRPHLAAYGASKAALNHLTKSLAAAHAEDLVSCTVVYPGNVLEGMWEGLGKDLAAVQGITLDEVMAQRLATLPSGRFQPVEDVADAVLYAATAQGLSLNGKAVWSEAPVLDL